MCPSLIRGHLGPMQLYAHLYTIDNSCNSKISPYKECVSTFDEIRNSNIISYVFTGGRLTTCQHAFHTPCMHMSCLVIIISFSFKLLTLLCIINTSPFSKTFLNMYRLSSTPSSFVCTTPVDMSMIVWRINVVILQGCYTCEKQYY